MSLTNKALFVIERNLNKDLSLAEIADACGVSRFHLAHAFGEVTGKPVMAYVRGRRLSEAAQKLQDGAADILTVSLDAGYASHEAFTRAFRAQFDMTPEEARRTHKSITLVEPVAHIDTRRQVQLSPRFEQLGELKFVGLGEPCFYDKTDRIPAQWRLFMQDHYERIPNRLKEMPSSVIQPSRNDDHMIYICAAGVSAFGTVSKNLTAVTVAAARYAVFEHGGHVTELPCTYAAIWDSWFPTSGSKPAEAPAIERHNPTFDTRTGTGGVSIWIPLGNAN